MSSVSLKCQYGLRALFELAKNEGVGMLRLNEIAARQAIPARFLENILNQLRQGGFVESRRGKDGGFLLAKSAGSIRVGDIIRFFEGPIHPVTCVGDKPKHRCPLVGGCSFIGLWEEASRALEAVYDAKTLSGLVEDEEKRNREAALNYCI
jgi:Rrf2 family protein